MSIQIAPSVDELLDLTRNQPNQAGKFVTIFSTFSLGDNFSPEEAFLKVRRGSHSFIFETATKEITTKIQYSIIGTEPQKIITSGVDPQTSVDPFNYLEPELLKYQLAEHNLKKINEPSMVNGGAFGYIAYDCMKYFEPILAPELSKQVDTLSIPESLFMFCHSYILFNHDNKTVSITALVQLDGDNEALKKRYQLAVDRVHELHSRLLDPTVYEVPDQDNTKHEAVSNLGTNGYREVVKKLKEHIVDGDIIQAVPSQRLSRKTGTHPYNIYKALRKLNPSRYIYFVQLNDFYIVGSSPELLVKCNNGVVTNHPIAGTRRRGATEEEDKKLEEELLADVKERAEHIMLVDLGRNDVNRVAYPVSTKVDALMKIERYSHVMHIVSEVSGTLREGFSGIDAFRSIFPAGTLTGAPKLKAMSLIAGFEPHCRRVYGGGLGVFAFDGSVDTAIAIRTLVFKDGVAHLQAGGGIVYDSDPEAEYMETINKMAATSKAIDLAESSSKTRGTDIVKAPSETAVKFNELFAELKTLPRVVSSDPSAATNAAKGKRILLIDNYDSFTYNIYQYLSQLGCEVIVFRNNVTLEECDKVEADSVVLSPGPGWPKDAGISMQAAKHFAGKLPVLGVCMGHECIVEAFGGKISHCGEVLHGKTSALAHDGRGIYKDVPQNVDVIRYHSLAAEVQAVPEGFDITSKTADRGVVMGIRHKKYVMESVQFHPESIKTDFGMQMLKNFIEFEGDQYFLGSQFLNEEVMDGPGAGTEDVSTFVGTAGQYGFTDGQGDQARFNCPSGITTNSEGDIFVCDYFNHVVRKITPEGLVTTIAGSPGHSGKSDGLGRRARFNHPHGIVADPFGNLFVCDYFNHTVRKVDSKGEVTTIAGVPGRKGYIDGPGATAKFYHPQDLAVDLDGNLFVTDQMNHVIRKITPQGDVTTVAGTAGQPGSRDSNPSSNESAMFNHPSGIAVDYYGNLFVCDTYNNTIRKVSKKGEVSTIAGMAGQSRSIDGDASHARFKRPFGITIDRDGNLFISDTFNQSIRKFSANDCKVSTISEASGWCESVSNGVIHYPKLNFPFGVAVSREGFLYVTDSHNYVVRRIQLQEQANQGPQSLSKIVFETLVLKKDWEGLAKLVEEETAEVISQEKLKATFSYSTTAFINSLIQLSLIRSGEKLNESQEILTKENKKYEERMATINKDKTSTQREIEELEKKLQTAREKLSGLVKKEKETEKQIEENEKHTKLNNLKKTKITMQLENLTESSAKEATAYQAFKAILKEKPFRTWETNEVCQLLKEIGLKHHTHNFISNQMTGAKVVYLNSTKLVSLFNFTFRESKQLISTIDLIAKKKNIYRSPVGVLAWSNEQVIEWLQENNLSHLIPICKVKQIAGEELLHLDEEDMTHFLQVEVPQLQTDFEYKLDKLRKDDRALKKKLKVDLSAEKADKQSPLSMAIQRFKAKNADNMAKIKKFKERMPSEFFCSLSGELLTDPVFASDGQIYERSIIEAWMSKYDTSPIIGTKFKSKQLETSNVLKNLIETFLRELV